MSQKAYNVVLLLFIIVGAVLVYDHYLESYYSIDSAKAFLSRAETAPTPDLMADALQESRALVPKKYWYTMNIPMPIYKTYLKYIRRIYSLVI